MKCQVSREFLVLLVSMLHLFIRSTSGSVPDFAFTQTLYEVSVNETYTEGGFLTPDDFLTLSCNQSNNTDLMYTLMADDTLPFTIDLITGELYTTSDLDYETVPEYNFTAVCTDADDLNLTAMATVIVSLLPVNEFRPRILPNPMITLFVNEQTPPGVLMNSLPGIEYNVFDMDQPSDNISFTLVEGLYDEIYYDEELNGVVLREYFDWENQSYSSDCINFPQFQIRVTVCDIYPLIEDCPNIIFLVTFFSTNEYDPMFDEAMYSFEIAESAPVNTIVATVTCTDQDMCIGGFAGMNIVDTNLLDTFSIDREGNLVNVQPLDYESVQSYTVSVRCFDSSRREAFTVIELQLVDDNDNSPVCSSNTSVNLQVGTYSFISVLELSCMDADQGNNSQLVFDVDGEFLETSGGQFTLNQTTGELTFTGEISSNDSFDFIVLVSDSGPTPLTTTVVVNVTIEERITTENERVTPTPDVTEDESVTLTAIVTEDERITPDTIPNVLNGTGAEIPFIIVIPCVVGGILLICLLLVFLCCCCYCCCCGRHRKKTTNIRRKGSLFDPERNQQQDVMYRESEPDTYGSEIEINLYVDDEPTGSVASYNMTTGDHVICNTTIFIEDEDKDEAISQEPEQQNVARGSYLDQQHSLTAIPHTTAREVLTLTQEAEDTNLNQKPMQETADKATQLHPHVEYSEASLSQQHVAHDTDGQEQAVLLQPHAAPNAGDLYQAALLQPPVAHSAASPEQNQATLLQPPVSHSAASPEQLTSQVTALQPHVAHSKTSPEQLSSQVTPLQPHVAHSKTSPEQLTTQTTLLQPHVAHSAASPEQLTTQVTLLQPPAAHSAANPEQLTTQAILLQPPVAHSAVSPEQHTTQPTLLQPHVAHSAASPEQLTTQATLLQPPVAHDAASPEQYTTQMTLLSPHVALSAEGLEQVTLQHIANSAPSLRQDYSYTTSDATLLQPHAAPSTEKEFSYTTSQATMLHTRPSFDIDSDPTSQATMLEPSLDQESSFSFTTVPSATPSSSFASPTSSTISTSRSPASSAISTSRSPTSSTGATEGSLQSTGGFETTTKL